MSVDLTPFEAMLDYNVLLDTDQVLCLLPVRLETRFVPAGQNTSRHLMIRVFPDDIHIDTHSSSLTYEEQLITLTFRQRMDAPGVDEVTRRALWGQFCGLVGTSRASYLGGLTETELLNISLAGSWQPPFARALPSRWVALCYKGGERVKVVVGNPIDYVAVSGVPDALLAGPNFSLGVDDVPASVDDILPAWMCDVGTAQGVGMALYVDLFTSVQNDEIWNEGLDSIIVVGLHTSDTAAQGAAKLEELLSSHMYVKGIDDVAYSTPTTSTSEAISSFDRRPVQNLFDRGFHSPQASAAPSSGSQSARVMTALGQTGSTHALHTLSQSMDTRDARTTAMHTLLWNVGAGYYLEQMLHPLTGWRERRIIRALYLEHVRGEGPLSALRIGAQPYGLLPTMAHSTYVPSLELSTTTLADPDVTEFPEHYRSGKVVEAWPFFATQDPWTATQMTQVLQSLRGHWLTQGVPQVPRIESADADPTGSLVQIIGQHHTVTQIRERAVLGGDAYERLVQKGWSTSSPLAWQQQQKDAINLLFDTLNVRAPQLPLANTPRIAGTHPFPVSQPLSTSTVVLNDASGAVTLAPSSYLDSLTKLPFSSWRTLESWQTLLSGPPTTLPLCATLAHRGLHRAFEAAAWHIAGKRGKLPVYPPLTPEFRNLGTSPNSPDDVPLQEVLDITLGTLGLSVANLTSTDTLEDAMEALLALCMNPTKSLDDVRGELFSNGVESWEIDEFYETCRAIMSLESVQSEALHVLMNEALDVSTHRIDAWLTGLATQRLFHIRKTSTTGLHLGGYGILEDIRPGHTLQALGVLHAPSQAQAQTLAVIKSGQLNHEGTPSAELLKIDASSKRVRQAMQTLEAMQSGHTLADVLGRVTERRLQELAVKDNVPDAQRLLTPLRRAFPAHLTNTPEGISEPSVADGRATDGLQLLRVHAGDTPDDVFTMLDAAIQTLESSAPVMTIAEKGILTQVMNELDERIDALHDVLLTESVHQSAQGNLARAQAALGVLSGESSPSTDLESMRTPYEGRRVTHRLGMLVSPSIPTSYPWGHDGTSPRTILAPALTAWIESWVPDPDLYICEVTGYALSGKPVHYHVSLGQLGLSGTDLLALPVDTTQAKEGILESYVKTGLYKALKAFSITLDVARPCRVNWSPAPFPQNKRTFDELLSLVAIMRRVLSSARPLKARDLVAPGEELGDEYGWDELVLRTQIDDVISTLTTSLTVLDDALTPGSVARDVLNATKTLWGDGLAPDLVQGQAVHELPSRTRLMELGSLMHEADATFMDDTTRAQLHDTLRLLSLHGIEGILPILPRALDKDDAGALMQACVLAYRALEKYLAHLDWNSAGADRSMIESTLVQLFGEQVLYTPVVTLSSLTRQAFEAQDALLDSDSTRLERWLTQVAQAHPQARHLSDLRMSLASLSVLPESMEGTELVVAQLPYKAGDDWLADGAGTGQESTQSLSLMCWGDEVTRQAIGGTWTQTSGLFVEEWVEFIPDALHTTGAAIHAESPKAKAPQAVLLAVPDELGQPWTLERVERTLLDTLDLAKIRGVDPECLGSLSHLLPTLYMPFTTITDDVSTDPI